jgi:hypothetical protein
MSRYVRILIASLGFVLYALPLSAQTVCPNPCSLTIGQSFSVQADVTPGPNLDGFRVYLDNVKQGADLPVTALQNGVVTIPSLTAPARGTHTIQIASFNADGESRSDPLTFSVRLPAPAKPGNLRILIAVVVAEDGSFTFKVVGIEEVDPAGGA